MSETFKVYGSHGEITADSKTGVVTGLLDYAGAENVAAGLTGDYADIVRIDVDEWRRRYPGEELIDGDILDFGFWTLSGKYEAASEEFRAECTEAG